jgi:hypothetical protein
VRLLPWFAAGFLAALLLDRILVWSWRNVVRPLPRIDR